MTPDPWAEPTVPAGCKRIIPGLKPAYRAKIPVRSTQVIVSRGEDRQSFNNQFQIWQKTNGCWTMLKQFDSYNGYRGWSTKPTTGSLLSPAGVFRLTDAGGRLRNPGTTLPYHWGPGSYGSGGYRMAYPVQIYNYVIAINFNRRTGMAPRKLRVPNPRLGSGYWIHQAGLGVTRGCLSLSQSEMVYLMRWIRKAQVPTIVMGPASMIGGQYSYPDDFFDENY